MLYEYAGGVGKLSRVLGKSRFDDSLELNCRLACCDNACRMERKKTLIVIR